MKKRQEDILFLITEDFIKTSIPVSSTRIVEIGDFKCSSATVRNEMVYLEKCKLIEKPHTSSGRIPTSKGYHYYIEHSKNGKKFSDLELLINEIFENRSATINVVIEQSCALIAEVLKLPVVMFQTKKLDKKNRIEAINFFRLNAKKAMIIIVSNEAVLIEKVVEVDNEIFEEMKICLAIISKRLFNSPLDEAIDRLNSIIPILEKNIKLFESKLKEIILDTFKQILMEVNVYGTTNVSNLPEFNQASMLQDMLFVLNESNIWNLLSSQFLNIQGVHTRLGYIRNMKFSVMSINVNNDTTLAVIGPKRVNYPMIMAALELIKKHTSKKKIMLEYLNKKGENDETQV